jgi:hypothetical protein
MAVCGWQNSLLGRFKQGESISQEALKQTDSLVRTGGIGQLILLLITAVLFLRWLHRLTALARPLGRGYMRWTPRDAVLAFFIPFVNIFRPYEVLRDLHNRLTPDFLPEPPDQTVVEDADYRGVRIASPPPPVRLPHAAIGAWWGAFWGGNLLANIASRIHPTTVDGLMGFNSLSMVSDAVDILSAGLGIVVVRGVTARLLERFRRVRHNPVEVLRENGLDLPATP